MQNNYLILFFESNKRETDIKHKKSKSPYKLEGIKPSTIGKIIYWSKKSLDGHPIIMTKFNKKYSLYD